MSALEVIVLTSEQIIPQKSACFFNENHEDDLNHAEAVGVQKSADLLGVFDQETPSSEYRAIRNYCLGCVCESPKEVRLCPSTNCALHPLRFGKRSPLAPRPLKSIRARCRNCSEYLGDVRHCDMPECALYPYRMGKRPKRVC
jgi:hypothetical protein